MDGPGGPGTIEPRPVAVSGVMMRAPVMTIAVPPSIASSAVYRTTVT